jgi:hypothetical protein
MVIHDTCLLDLDLDHSIEEFGQNQYAEKALDGHDHGYENDYENGHENYSGQEEHLRILHSLQPQLRAS